MSLFLDACSIFDTTLRSLVPITTFRSFPQYFFPRSRCFFFFFPLQFLYIFWFPTSSLMVTYSTYHPLYNTVRETYSTVESRCGN